MPSPICGVAMFTVRLIWALSLSPEMGSRTSATGACSDFDPTYDAPQPMGILNGNLVTFRGRT